MATQRVFTIVNAELELVAAAKEQGFSVSFREWDRIHDLVAALPGPERVAANLAWACVAVAASGLLAFITWSPAYAQLDNNGRFDFAWVSPALLIITVACLVVAGLSFWFDKHVKKEQARSATHICEDMDHIAGRFRLMQVRKLDPEPVEEGKFDPDEIPF